MTRYFCVLLSALSIVILLVGEVSAWEGIVVKVIDGDSLKVRRNGKVYEIRLYGIDTPEYRQPYSNKAKQFSKRIAYKQIVTVEEKDIDRYGRIVALVMSQGKMVNMELVREGLAWYYPKYCRQQPLCGEFKRLEHKARKENRGLWRDKSPVAPWDWKRQKKTSSSKSAKKWYYRILGWL